MSNNSNRFIQGDALDELRKFPTGSIDMCLTSPPYWSLRDYGIGPNQLGLEPNPELYIDHLTEIFNEVKRVLKKEGTLWLNIGDTYSGGGFCGSQKALKGKQGTNRGSQNMIGKALNGILPPKCLLMIPERLSWSLIQDGWILRNKIIWYKPNAMPSSVKDRFSNRWEYLFMFSKNQRYYFDLDAVREAYTEPMNRWGGDNLVAKGESTWDKATGQVTYRDRNMRPNPDGKNPGDILKVVAETRTMGAIIGSGGGVKVPGGKGWTGHPPGGAHRIKYDPRWCPPEGKNPGDFFETNTQPFPEAHFAVFPERLCEKPIKAGCPKEICKKCGKARERILKPSKEYKKYLGKAWHDHGNNLQKGQRIQDKINAEYKTVGWTDCKCKAGFEPGVVLDPFCGAGTVGVVAKSLGRRFILIDIKKEYIRMSERRVIQVGHQKELFEI